ncbi:MAG: zinc ribbon domain-containing protein [Spirochaetaceae bacterium]|jgi:hypothetical protein|nr:zinc ribbon domain-containing protein [Spirochaetaceae bacterium]
MENIPLVICGVPLVFGLLNLCIELKLLTIRNKPIRYITSFFVRVYDNCFIPLSVITIVYYTLTIFLDGKSGLFLICIGCFVLAAFVINTIRERTCFFTSPDDYEPQHSEYKAAFTFIDTYHEITKLNRNVLQDIAERKKLLHDKHNELENLIATATKNINNYVVFQQEGCSLLFAKKKQCEAIYVILEQTAEKLNDTLTKLAQRLEYSAAALCYYGESDVLIKDIHTSFKDAYNQNNEETMRNIEKILSDLSVLAFKCADIQSFPKSYNNAISIYSGKIMSVLQMFERESTENKEQITQLCTEILEKLIGKEREMVEVNKRSMEYILKNNFVLSKIAQSYDNSIIAFKNPNIYNSTLRRRKTFCDKCGTKIEETHTRCPRCGTSIYV